MGGIILSREFFLSCHLRTSILSDMRSPYVEHLFSASYTISILKIERNHQNQCKYKKNRHIRIRNQSFRTRSIIFFFTNSWKWGLEKQCNLRYCLVIAFLYTLHGSLCNVSVRSNKDLYPAISTFAVQKCYTNTFLLCS